MCKGKPHQLNDLGIEVYAQFINFDKIQQSIQPEWHQNCARVLGEFIAVKSAELGMTQEHTLHILFMGAHATVMASDKKKENSIFNDSFLLKFAENLKKKIEEKKGGEGGDGQFGGKFYEWPDGGLRKVPYVGGTQGWQPPLGGTMGVDGSKKN